MRKAWTIVEGLDLENANSLSKIWKKKFSCASDVITEDETLIVKLQGDHILDITPLKV